jgi:CDP-diacylglycerol--glycerol-3-phosphate 3-phosphatidyltransferase
VSSTAPKRIVVPAPPKPMIGHGRFWTPPNILSVGRLFLLVPLFVFLRKGSADNGDFWAMVIMGIALLTDMLDGFIARVFRQESEWGRVLDPLADKTWLGCLAIFLALPWRAHPLPWEFLMMMLVRDVLIVAGAYLVFARTGHVVRSNWLGKIAMIAEALTLISYTYYWKIDPLPWLKPEVFIWITSLLLVASAASYTLRARQLFATLGLQPHA